MLEHIIDSTEVSLLESTHLPQNIRLPVFKTKRHPSYEDTNHTFNTEIDELPDCMQAIRITNKIHVLDNFISSIKQKMQSKEMLIISVWGPQNSGKSFLLDVLISMMNQKTMRKFSNLVNQGANAYFFQSKKKGQKNVLFLDWSGYTQVLTKVDQNALIMMYIISSGIIFNRMSGDLESEQRFICLCKSLEKSVSSKNVKFTLPKLTILSRDHKQKSNLETKLEATKLFHPNITEILFSNPYDTSQNILDIPQSILDPSFLKSTRCLNQIIQSSTSQNINQVPIFKNIAILLPLISEYLNKFNVIDIDEIWSCLLELRMAEQKNQFMIIYSEQLEEEFSDDNFYPDVELFYRLQKVKMRSFHRFKPSSKQIYHHFRQMVKSKQKIIREINQKKSSDASQNFLKECVQQFQAGTPRTPDEVLREIETNLGASKYLTAYQITVKILGRLQSNTRIDLLSNVCNPKLSSALNSIQEQLQIERKRKQEIEQQFQIFKQTSHLNQFRQKQQTFKRTVEETYYMNKAYWQLKSERQNSKNMEVSKIKEYYLSKLKSQEKQILELKDHGKLVQQRESRDIAKRVQANQNLIIKKNSEIEALKEQLKSVSKKKWLCCW